MTFFLQQFISPKEKHSVCAGPLKYVFPPLDETVLCFASIALQPMTIFPRSSNLSSHRYPLPLLPSPAANLLTLIEQTWKHPCWVMYQPNATVSWIQGQFSLALTLLRGNRDSGLQNNREMGALPLSFCAVGKIQRTQVGYTAVRSWLESTSLPCFHYG